MIILFHEVNSFIFRSRNELSKAYIDDEASRIVSKRRKDTLKNTVSFMIDILSYSIHGYFLFDKNLNFDLNKLNLFSENNYNIMLKIETTKEFIKAFCDRYDKNHIYNGYKEINLKEKDESFLLLDVIEMDIKKYFPYIMTNKNLFLDVVRYESNLLVLFVKRVVMYYMYLINNKKFNEEDL